MPADASRATAQPIAVSSHETRVALVAMPALVRDIIRATVDREPDFRIVAEYTSADTLLSALLDGATHPPARDPIGIVMLGVDDGSARDAVVPSRILEVLPSARVLAVATDGRTAALHVLRPQQLSLGEISPATLVHALRYDPHDGRHDGPSVLPLAG